MNADDPRPKHSAEEERKNREAALDHTIEDSFPASDPPSTDPNPDDEDGRKRQQRDQQDTQRR
ncbi:MAG: hypothetical protein ABI880_07565 [Acidobacteriota bacterium]